MRILNSSETSVCVYLDTRNLTPSSDGYQFNIEDSIIIPRGFHICASLASAEIPFSFYSTNQYNNQLTIFSSLTNQVHTLSIPHGNYTPYKLVAILKAWLAPIDPAATVSYDQYTNAFTFAMTGGATNITYYWNISSSREQFGFTAQQVTVDAGHPASSNIAVNLTYTNSIYLMTNLTDKSSIDSWQSVGLSSNILQKIPINTTPGGIIYFTHSMVAHKSLFHTSSINQIRFQLLDDHRRPIDFRKAPYALAIVFDFVPDSQLVRPEEAPELGVGGPLLTLPVEEAAPQTGDVVDVAEAS